MDERIVGYPVVNLRRHRLAEAFVKGANRDARCQAADSGDADEAATTTRGKACGCSEVQGNVYRLTFAGTLGPSRSRRLLGYGSAFPSREGVCTGHPPLKRPASPTSIARLGYLPDSLLNNLVGEPVWVPRPAFFS